MIKFLEDLLHEKTKDTQSAILFAQWNYDKKIIPSALQAVSNLFPHYSLHDESHSITIINNIIRILGKENIIKLSAIDIWLILEAAYCHDIGMVVSSQELVASVQSPQFIEFFKDLIQDSKSGLHEFAIQFQIEDNKIVYRNTAFDLALNDGIKFILAEYFRRIHAERSKEIITHPLLELSLQSPRGVIPPRIFKILGDICSCHTKNFSDVLNLSFSEVGIDIENAHPRFVACVLRIGDLLDLDNNRFSEVMLRTLTRVPMETLIHKAKHLSIESFRVDRNRIEITANCKDYDTASITQHWFNYLNSEINSQTINWNIISPFKELGPLPTIGNLKVELANYELIDGKHKPKFGVDTDKALGLLQGAGIYEGAYQCIREILQNAVDATLIRLWLEHQSTSDLTTPQSNDFIKLAKNYPINIIITKKGIEGNQQNWEIIIADNGIGISSHDLKFLMNTGSSSRNKERTAIIDNMPIWMKPSGTFGIGFQSIFMLTDLVVFETKSFFNEEFQIVELNSPSSRKSGDILIQKKKTTHSTKPGTKIIINHKTNAIPQRYSVSFEHRNAMITLENFDPFSHESLDIELAKIIDEIFNFANKNYIPVNLTIDDTSIPTSSNNRGKFDYFDPETSLEIKIHGGSKDTNWRFITYYKNQKAENNIRLEFLGFEVNIHKEKASEVLTLNRNKIKSEHYDRFFDDFFKAAFKIITTNFDEIFKTVEEKSLGSMFLNYYLSETKAGNISQFNQWEDLEINLGANSMKFKKLLESIDSLKLIYDNKISNRFGEEYKLQGKELEIYLVGESPAFSYTKFFLFKAAELFTSVRRLPSTEKNLKEVIFTKEKGKGLIPNDELITVIKGLRQGYPDSARAIIPCIEDFFVLRIRNEAFKPYVYRYYIDYNVRFAFPQMLSPFICEKTFDNKRTLKIALGEKVIDWVYQNRYDEKTTRKEIEDGYSEFCKRVNLEEVNKEP